MKIEPATTADLPAANATVTVPVEMGSDESVVEAIAKARKLTVDTWQKAYETLKSKYSSPAQQPSRADGALYRGKPAIYWIGQYRDTDPKTRKEALDALGALAKKDKSLISFLIDAFEDKEMGVHATVVIVQLGEDAVPALVEVLRNNTSIPVRRRAALALANMGGGAKSAVPALRQMLQDKDASLVNAATNALGQIGPGAKERSRQWSICLVVFSNRTMNLRLKPTSEYLASLGRTK